MCVLEEERATNEGTEVQTLSVNLQGCPVEGTPSLREKIQETSEDRNRFHINTGKNLNPLSKME